MISVFQIFRMLIGIIVFIFVLTFFLQVAGMYSTTQERSKKLDAMSAFDQIASQAYTSENPATFSGFTDMETLVYEPPKLKTEAGQKTLSVPVLFMPGKGQINMEKRCSEYGWFRSCWVYAFPEATKIVFNMLDASQETRALVADAVRLLPATIQFGYCSGSDAMVSGRDGYLSYLASLSYGDAPCQVQMLGLSQLVVVDRTFNYTRMPNGTVFMATEPRTLVSGAPKSWALPAGYSDGMDVAAFLTGGAASLEYKRSAFQKELLVSTRVMKERTILVSQKMMDLNRQPCQECATPFQQECGWTDFRGNSYESGLYKAFITSLDALEKSSGNQQLLLKVSVNAFNELKDRGCE